ncbi:hypothetical protein JCM3770_006983 [Rhodotorula araucariae]
MGLFSHKKNTSPSGFFNADPSPSEERGELDAMKSRRRSSSSGRHAERTSLDTSRDKSSSTGGGAVAGAAAAATGAAAASHSGTSRDNEEPQVDTRRSTGPLSNETTSGSTASAGLPAGAAPSAASPPTAHRDAATAAPTSGSTSGIDRELAGLPSVGTQDGTSGVARRASIRETAAAPHQHDQSTADTILSEEQAKLAAHDHKYLEPVVHERRHVHEVEELERQRVVDRHIHHIQHHVQPLVDERHLEVVHSYREVPVTHVEETHANTADDRALLARLNAQSMSTYTVVPHERVRIDKGETQVTENVIHHYHTIVMPVWQRDLHEFYRLNSNFSPATMINSHGGPASQTAHHANNASPAVQAGGGPSFGSVSHPPGASVVPGGISLMGPPQPREGHKLVPDQRPEVGGEGTQYEVEFVNREPVYTASAVQPGAARQGGASGLYSTAKEQVTGHSATTGTSHRTQASSLGKTSVGGHLATTVGGHQPLTGQSTDQPTAQPAVQSAGQSTGQSAGQSTGQSTGQRTGLESGVQDMNLGVAR